MAVVTGSDRVRAFVGRDAELRALTGLLGVRASGSERAGGDPAVRASGSESAGGDPTRGQASVLYLHAIAGMGKSALLQAFLERARGLDASVVHLDCRTVEPTERGFLRAAGGWDDVKALHEHLATVVPPVVLVLDHCEVFRLMDTWLRQLLVPALPDRVTLVLVGREPPVSGWFAIRGFRTLPLRPLDDADACTLLEQRDVAVTDAARLNRIARGHPLALVLASAGVVEHPELALEDAAITRVVAELARLYMEDVGDARTREALQAACVVRRSTAPLLAAMLADGDGAEAVRRLLELPFVEAGRDGLVVHEAVRDAVAGFLRGTDPVRYRRLRHAAWRELRNEVRQAGSAELWRYTADMLYLIDNPVVREAFFPSGAQPLAVEPARAEDGDAISAIARRHEGREAVAILERWRADEPQTLSVVRDRDAAVVGFLMLLEGRMLRRVGGDPVVVAWARHLHEHPLPKGEIALGLRRWLDAEQGEGPCAVQAACWLDVKRTYMELRPALRRIYVVVRDLTTYWPVVEKLAFRRIPEADVVIDGITCHSVVLDFGPDSVDGWLAGLVEAELGLGHQPAIDTAARELSVAGEQVALTPLEFGVFTHLRERAGKTISRTELLGQVWGTEFVGGSNVVDAVVRSLRRKLGPAAVVIETVRGSGYRLRGDWRAHLS